MNLLANTKLNTKLVKWVGYPLFALFAFLIFLYITFPYEKLKEQVEQRLSASGGMLVTIEEMGPSPLFGIAAHRVLLVLTPRTRGGVPAPAEGAGGAGPGRPKPTRVFLEKVVVKVGLLGLLSGGTNVHFQVEGFGGEVEGAYSTHKKEGWSLELEAKGLDLGEVPAVQDLIGLPARGVLSGNIELTVPEHRLSKASGVVGIECDACTIGDGKAKIKVPGNPLLAMGVTLPRIQLGRLGGQIKVEKGVATFENVSAKSSDVEVNVEGSVALQDPVAFSNSQAYVRFRISPELRKRDAKFELLENGLSTAKRPDGYFGLQVIGSLRSLRFNPSSTGPGNEQTPRRRRRPLGSLPKEGQAPLATNRRASPPT